MKGRDRQTHRNSGRRGTKDGSYPRFLRKGFTRPLPKAGKGLKSTDNEKRPLRAGVRGAGCVRGTGMAGE